MSRAPYADSCAYTVQEDDGERQDCQLEVLSGAQESMRRKRTRRHLEAWDQTVWSTSSDGTLIRQGEWQQREVVRPLDIPRQECPWNVHGMDMDVLRRQTEQAHHASSASA